MDSWTIESKSLYSQLDRKFSKVRGVNCIDGLVIYCISLDLGRDRISQRLEPGQIEVACPGTPGVGQSREIGWKDSRSSK